jgi:predicted ATPase/transcriptional regulator with XRE-family HTH domain
LIGGLTDNQQVYFSFGAWMQRRRKALDLTQKELARQVGLSPVTLTKLERDERRPSRQVAWLLAEALVIPSTEREAFVRAARGEQGVHRLPDPLTYPLFPLPVEEVLVIDQPASKIDAEPLSAITAISQSSIPRLPGTLTPLVGRSHEIAQIGVLLQEPTCRLLTLSGPGGVGKTRLALEAAHRYGSGYVDGVVFISLAPVASASYIPAAIADALNLQFRGGEPVGRQVLAYLWGKHLLCVLDNIEHLLKDGAADWMVELLESTPGIKVLATSRERLNLRGEWVFDVHGLPVPELPETGFEPREEVQNSCLALFLQSARRIAPDYFPEPPDWKSIVRICQLVDGLPLGIELAAGWLRILSPAEIAGEIENSLDFLEATVRDLPERHRSLRAVFDHSWVLLSVQEQIILRRLAVFRGGFERDQARSVSNANLLELSNLLDKSLILRTSPSRYDLHELVRQYAGARLIESGERADICDAHLAAYLQLARDYSVDKPGNEPIVWRNRIDDEINNFRAALEWSLHGGNSNQGLELALEIWRYWLLSGLIAEGRWWLEQLIVRYSLAPIELRIRAHWRYAALARHQGDYIAARHHLEIASTLARHNDDRLELAAVLNELSLLAMDQQDFFTAEKLGLESLSLMQTAENRSGEALLTYNLGRISLYRGEFDSAEQCFTKSLNLAGSIMIYA